MIVAERWRLRLRQPDDRRRLDGDDLGLRSSTGPSSETDARRNALRSMAYVEVSMATVKILTGLCVTVAFAGAALAEDSRAQSINTGGEKGAYHTEFCPPLPAALSNEYFQSYKCTPSKGTLENIDRVLKNPTSLGFVQLDIYANEASKRPEEFKKLTVVRSDIACEGLWMVTKNPALNNYGHVLALSRRIPFVLPAQASGSAATFAFLQANDRDGLGRVPEANIRYAADATAVLNEAAYSTAGAVGFFVQFADPENANIKLIVEKGLTVIPVASRQILHLMLNDRKIYQLQTFTLRLGGLFVRATEATTVCTPVGIITGTPEAFGNERDKDDQRDLIETVREVPAERLLPQESRVAQLIRDTKKASERVIEEMSALVERTRKAIEERSP
jgi:hypothetical protein